MLDLHSIRVVALFSLTACALGGCSADLDGLEGAGVDIRRGVLCAFSDRDRIAGDSDAVEALVHCQTGSDCSDRRTVQRGGTFDVLIEFDAEFAESDLRVESSDPAALEVEGFDERVLSCDDGGGLEGSVAFKESGESALIVFAGDREIDRFTVTAYDPDHIDIAVQEGLSFAGSGHYDVVDELSFETPHTVRALVRSESGERLVGGNAFEWSVDDAGTAALFGDDPATSATGPVVWLKPVAIGSSALHVQSGDLETTLPLRVTAVAETPAEP